MSLLREMTWIACMVAGDVTKHNKEDVRHMVENTSFDSVWDFFWAYNIMFSVSMNKQMEYLEEVQQEMEE